MSDMDAVRAIDFLEIVGRLKTTKRTGWLRYNICLPESIAGNQAFSVEKSELCDEICAQTTCTAAPWQRCFCLVERELQ
jgi:5'-deoxynucleotidase YfbR-like HD superfamily hydrolase